MRSASRFVHDADDPALRDDAAACARLEAVRWADGPACPYCGAREAIERLDDDATGAGLLLCGTCRAQFTVATGTALEQSRVPLHKWVRAMHLLGAEPTQPEASPLLRLFPEERRDPDLYLAIGGRRLRPVRVSELVYVFDLPAGGGEVRIVSRSIVPSERDPAALDGRRLGIALTRITVRPAQGKAIDWPCSHPALLRGFHAAEEGLRWTTGNAMLPGEFFRSLVGGFRLELHLRRPPWRAAECG